MPLRDHFHPPLKPGRHWTSFHAMWASMNLYRAIMFGPSPLSRRQREMMATVVSASNGCHY